VFCSSRTRAAYAILRNFYVISAAKSTHGPTELLYIID
jgi:hypothetical protein